jgi:hypothetical protein
VHIAVANMPNLFAGFVKSAAREFGHAPLKRVRTFRGSQRSSPRDTPARGGAGTVPDRSAPGRRAHCRGRWVVLNEVSNRMIPPRRALANCPDLKRALRFYLNRYGGSENTVRRHGRKSSKRGPIRIWIQCDLQIYCVHDMFSTGSPVNPSSQVGP